MKRIRVKLCDHHAPGRYLWILVWIFGLCVTLAAIGENWDRYRQYGYHVQKKIDV